MDPILSRYVEQRGGRNAPVLLFKFLSSRSEYFTSGLVELLYHSRICLSKRDSFNDPFDTRVHVGPATAESLAALRSVLVDYGNEIGASKEVIETVATADGEEAHRRFVETLNRTLDSLGLYSLSEEVENPLMWAHYASAHSGVCVVMFGFHREIQLPHVFPVLYGEAHPVIENLSYDSILEAGPLHKGKAWMYEREWRVVLPDGADKFFAFDPRLAKALILGIRASSATRRAMQGMLEIRQRLGLPLVRLYQAVQQVDRYELSFQEVWPERGPLFDTFEAALSYSDTPEAERQPVDSPDK